MTSESQKKIVLAGEPMRLDRHLVALGLVPGRRQARRLCEAGLILTNGRRAKPGELLSIGDSIEIRSSETEIKARPELCRSLGGPLSYLRIIYEDEWFIVLHKPRGMHSVTLRPDDALTVADCLAAYLDDVLTASPDPRESGLVHRLDRFTSGVLVAAKNRPAWEKLRANFRLGRVEKTYLALVEGRFPDRELETDAALFEAKDSPRVRVRRSEKKLHLGLKAKTSFENVLSRQLPHFTKELSLVRARALRARRHQIRAHLSALGHPLVGDSLYGSSVFLEELPDELRSKLRSAKGFYLLAETIRFSHPKTGEEQLFSADREPFVSLWLEQARMKKGARR